MVPVDNVAGGGSMAVKIQRGQSGSSGAQEKGEKRLRLRVNTYSHNLHG